MKTNSFDNIAEILRKNENPYLDVYLKPTPYSKSFAGKYECTDCLPEDTLKDKTEKAVVWLDDFTNHFPDGTLFIVNSKSSSRANGTGITGPFEFSKRSENSETGNNNLQSQFPTPQELSGLGYVHQAAMHGQLLEQRLNHSEELNRLNIEKVEALHKKQIEDIEYVSNRWSPEAFTAMIEKATPLLTGFLNRNIQTPIAGTQEKAVKADPKNVYVNSVANKLKDFEPESIMQIEEMIDNYKKALENDKLNEDERNINKETE